MKLININSIIPLIENKNRTNESVKTNNLHNHLPIVNLILRHKNMKFLSERWCIHTSSWC